MKHIIPGACHVIVASRHQDGAVGLFYTRQPNNWLITIGGQLDLDRVEVRPGAAAVQVTEQLRARFAAAHVPSSALAWYLIDFQQALDALDEYDLQRGHRISSFEVKVDDAVYVNSLGRGIVVGFTTCGRVKVRLDRIESFPSVVAHAPRSLLKPVLRSVAL